ncbi:hypothetical protein K1719_041740 [Acacia pycnantha]|nr:hypothetical protein K1719_041740 [Acacia pycnantha]
MYPFERFLRTLKHKIKNPRYVEGSIAEAYLVEEAAKFASYYYPLEMMSRWRGVPRNDDAGDTRDQKSIFNFPGRVVGKRSRSTLGGRDKRVAECYFSNSVRSANPSMLGSEVDQFTNSEFPKWLRSYFVKNTSDPNEVAWSLSYGAAISVTRCKKYIINGYRFSTVEANAEADCRIVKAFLNRYALISSQQINYQKSSLLFSPSVPYRMKKLSELLGVRFHSRLGKYLGTYIDDPYSDKRKYEEVV